MRYEIRPIEFSEILQRAFRVLVENFVLIVGTNAVVWVPYGILSGLLILLAQKLEGPANFVRPVVINAVRVPSGNAAFSLIQQPPSPETIVKTAQVIAVIVIVLLWVAVTIARIATVVAIANVYLDRPTRIGTCYRAVAALARPVLWTFLVFALCGFGIGVLYGFPAGLMIGMRVSPSVARPVSILLGLGAAILYIYLTVCWTFWEIVVAIERRSGMSALRQSRQLVRGEWGYTLGVLILTWCITAAPTSFIARAVTAQGPGPFGVLVLAALVAIASSYSALVLVIYYFNRRARVEGFDLRQLARHVNQWAGWRGPVRGAVPLH